MNLYLKVIKELFGTSSKIADPSVQLLIEQLRVAKQHRAFDRDRLKEPSTRAYEYRHETNLSDMRNIDLSPSENRLGKKWRKVKQKISIWCLTRQKMDP